jgi:proteasome assembly chaperone 3
MQTLHSLYASQIATIIWTSESDSTPDVSRRSVVVGISLRKPDKSGDNLAEDEKVLFLQVMSMLRDLLTES